MSIYCGKRRERKSLSIPRETGERSLACYPLMGVLENVKKKYSAWRNDRFAASRFFIQSTLSIRLSHFFITTTPPPRFFSSLASAGQYFIAGSPASLDLWQSCRFYLPYPTLRGFGQQARHPRLSRPFRLAAFSSAPVSVPE